MMLRNRRAVLLGLASTAVGAFSIGPALSQAAYPTQGIKFIIPAGAGGLPDTVSRILGRRLQERIGQSVVTENKAGGNGAVSVAALMSSPPDGTAFIVQDGSIYAINPHIYAKMAYNISDLIPDRDDRSGAAVSRRAPEGAGEDDEGVHRLREGQSRQAQLRLVRRRLHASSVDGGAQVVARPGA